MNPPLKWVLSAAVIVAAGLVWGVMSRLQETDTLPVMTKGSRVIAVEAADIQTGVMTLRRVYSGALESTEKFIVAPKVSGRVEVLTVDIGDTIKRGQVVARLDNAEYVQAVAQAEADLAVAMANQVDARSNLEIATRDLARVETLNKKGVSSESQLDEARARQLSANARHEITRAQVARAESSLETARIKLGYTRVTADWTGGDDARIVAENFVAEGDTVSANTPLVSIVELNPITGVIYVTERDYAQLDTAFKVSLSTDAFPGRWFSGHIARIAPVFKETTRQARVEVIVDNPDNLLKPGMFVRVRVVLEQVHDAVIVPVSAITLRNDQTGVFVIQEPENTVSWQAVTNGIVEDGRIQVSGLDPAGRVVTLGQQMLDTGSRVRTVDAQPEERSSGQGS